jgi:hypothetical protein
MTETMEGYLARVEQRLVAEGFRCSRAGVDPWLLVAEKSGFELTKFGNVDTSVHIGNLGAPQPEALTALSAHAFAAASGTSRGFRMPGGFFQALFSHAVAIVDVAPASLVEFIEVQQAPKHWAAFESVALFELATGRLHTFAGTPLWGAAYAAGTRKLQQRLFG